MSALKQAARSGFIAAALVLASGPVAAIDPMTASGLAPLSVQDGGGTGSVNVLNGNLTLSIPIGPTYQVNEGLSYGLRLTYSSNLRRWVKGHDGPILKQYARGRSTVGWGWLLHFGRIAANPEGQSVARPEWAYQDPDGAWHPLHSTSDGNVCAGISNPCHVTKDGTHIRAERTGSGWRLAAVDAGRRRARAEQGDLRQLGLPAWTRGAIRRLCPSGRLRWLVHDQDLRPDRTGLRGDRVRRRN